MGERNGTVPTEQALKISVGGSTELSVGQAEKKAGDVTSLVATTYNLIISMPRKDRQKLRFR